MQRAVDFIADTLVILTILFIITFALLAYGRYWPKRWQGRIPLTNLRDVERSIGKPLHVTTNGDGTVKWDYTRWWSGPAKIYFYTNGDFYRIFTEW